MPAPGSRLPDWQPMGEMTMDKSKLKSPKAPTNRRSLLWNILTVLMLLGVICLVVYFVFVFMNPNSMLNPFPPQLLPTLYQSPTFTITPRHLDPTWTPTITLAPSPSRTRAPTWTPLPGMISKTPTEIPTDTLEPTITTTPGPATAAITYKPSTDIHPEKGCSWMGVGGQVLDAAGKPLQYQTLQLGGTLDGTIISHLNLSGTASAYGQAGYEFVLGDHPIASTQTLWIQLFDNTGKALTDKLYFDTFADCNRNLVMIAFTKTK
jgi:hypothetical protein